jgi:hypothetical protein
MGLLVFCFQTWCSGFRFPREGHLAGTVCVMSSGSVAVERTTLSLVLMEFWFAVGSGWEAGPPPGKTGGHLLRKSPDAGLGIELRRVPKGGAVFRSHF